MKHNRWMALLLLLITVCTLFYGCKKEEQKTEAEVEEKGAINLYYLNKEEDGLYPVSYDLRKADDPEAAAKEIIFLLTDTENENADQYKASIYKGVTPPSVEISDQMAIVDFGTNYQQLDADKEILLRSSLVQSLVQVKGIDSVSFTINGSSLTGPDGEAVGVMTADTFILSRRDFYSQKEEVVLYYANKEGNGLVPVKKEIDVSDNMPIETKMLDTLIREPGPEGTRNPLPSGLTINQTQVYNGICYVDLSDEIDDILPEMEDRVKVYSMVNTLTDRGSASMVQFTVEGRPLEKLNDFQHFDRVMTNDLSLSEQKSKEAEDQEEPDNESESR